MFLDFSDKGNKRRKVVLLYVLGILELGIILGVGYFAWESRTSESTAALLSAIVVICGFVASAVVGHLKKKSIAPTG